LTAEPATKMIKICDYSRIIKIHWTEG